MTIYVAFLRAVNVGGTGKLPMTDLKAMCDDLGFGSVKTYIASGNVVLTSEEPTSVVKAMLEDRLEKYAGKMLPVFVRTRDELLAVADGNPFAAEDPSKTVAIFLDEPALPDVAADLKGRQDEVVQPGRREIYAYYPSGMGRSKLRIPAADSGTARNMNTIAKMLYLAGDIDDS